MAITITHPATIEMYITFDGQYKMGVENKSIDDVTEMACDMMIEHNFHIAEIKNILGYVLVKIERS